MNRRKEIGKETVCPHNIEGKSHATFQRELITVSNRKAEHSGSSDEHHNTAQNEEDVQKKDSEDDDPAGMARAQESY